MQNAHVRSPSCAHKNHTKLHKSRSYHLKLHPTGKYKLNRGFNPPNSGRWRLSSQFKHGLLENPPSSTIQFVDIPGYKRPITRLGDLRIIATFDDTGGYCKCHSPLWITRKPLWTSLNHDFSQPLDQEKTTINHQEFMGTSPVARRPASHAAAWLRSRLGRSTAQVAAPRRLAARAKKKLSSVK